VLLWISPVPFHHIASFARDFFFFSFGEHLELNYLRYLLFWVYGVWIYYSPVAAEIGTSTLDNRWEETIEAFP